MSPLSLTELSRREELEHIIQLGLGTFYYVGSALLEIRDSRLYRSTHATFEDYCRDRWIALPRIRKSLGNGTMV